MSLLWDPTLTAWRPVGDLAPVVERALVRLRESADEVAASRGHDVPGEDVRSWVKDLCSELGPASPVCPPALGGRVVVWSWEDGGAVAYEQAEALTLALPGVLPWVLLPDMWRALDGEELEQAKRAAAGEVLHAEGRAGMEEAEARWQRERVSGALVATDADAKVRIACSLRDGGMRETLQAGAGPCAICDKHPRVYDTVWAIRTEQGEVTLLAHAECVAAHDPGEDEEPAAPSEPPATCEACRRHPVGAVFATGKPGQPMRVCLGCLEQASVRARRRKWRTVA